MHLLRNRITWDKLYLLVLARPEAKVPRFCHRLEQLVLDGQQALADHPWLFTVRLYNTSKQCIRYSLYGYIFRDGEDPTLVDNIEFVII